MCVHGMERIKKYPMSCGMGYDRRWRPEASNGFMYRAVNAQLTSIRTTASRVA